MKKSKIGTIILAIFTVLIVGLTVFVCFNYHLAKDFVRSFSYDPTPEVATLENNLSLTTRGDLVFRASTPYLESKGAFNEHCSAYNPGVSVLGCYNNDVIYIYDIESEELGGVIESTASHELLHAVWARYSDSKKSQLAPLIEAAYAENKDSLSVIEEYDDSSRLDEIFVRVGTEISDISSELEAVYAEFFTDRTKIVSYYEKYHGVFDELSKRIKTLSKEIEQLGKSIEQKTVDYTTRSEALSTAVNEFNTCADTIGCFSSYDFITRRSELVAEQTALHNLYDEINAEVKAYNDKIAEYNQNALKTDYYNNMINSNIKE